MAPDLGGKMGSTADNLHTESRLRLMQLWGIVRV